MHRIASLLALFLLSAPAHAGPGIDLSANRICPGIAGASGDGGTLDCAALAKTEQYISVLGTWVPAEDLPDVNGLDGRIEIDIIGDLMDDSPTGGAFWFYNPIEGCLNQHGGTIQVAPNKPAAPGTQCGTQLVIRGFWSVGLGASPAPSSPNHATFNFSMGGGDLRGIPITTAQRIFGFELRLDPAYSREAGGECGTCALPVCLTWSFAHIQRVDFDHAPFPTDLTTPTGVPGVSNVAFFNAGCSAVPTRPRTWGQLKSLYR